MGSSTRLAKLISTIAFSAYFFIIIFQIPIFRLEELLVVACHMLWSWRNKEYRSLHFVRPANLWILVQQRASYYTDTVQQNRLLYDAIKHQIFISWTPAPIGVPCRRGICKTPLELTSSQLIASEVFPLFIVKALIYPGSLAKAIFKLKTIPSYRNLLHNFNTRTISAVSELQRLEVLAGSYLAVGGAILGLIKPGRMGLFGILLLMWGLIRELIMIESGFSHAKGIRIYPTILFALVSAFFSIRRDVRELIRTFNLKRVRKAKHF